MAVNENSKKIIVPRLIQLDAKEFDESIQEVLLGLLTDTSKFLPPGLLSNWEAEQRLFLDVLLYYNSIFKNGQTFGQTMLNLKYDRFLKGKEHIMYIVLTIILPYFKRHFDDSYRNISGKERSVINSIWNWGKLAQLLNILWFLREGLYPTVIERVLGLKFVHVNKPDRRVSYNFMMRELIWHSFTELLMFSLPLINLQAIKRRFRMLWSKSSNNTQMPCPVLNLTTTCALCQLRPNTPCRISIFCCHVACYICLKANIMADEKFRCPECFVENTASREFQYLTS